jgi:hypothetical protein
MINDTSLDAVLDAIREKMPRKITEEEILDIFFASASKSLSTLDGFRVTLEGFRELSIVLGWDDDRFQRWSAGKQW